MLVRARLSVKTFPENALLRQAGGRPMAAPYTFNRQECDFLEERNPSKQLAAQRLAGAGEREVGKLLIVKGAAQDQHIHISQ